MSVVLNYKNKLEINTGTEAVPVYSRLAVGINSADISYNDEIYDVADFAGEGFKRSVVTGGQLVITLTGDRVYGDVAQDYIFSKGLERGDDRETQFKFTDANLNVTSGDITFCNITGPSGDANAVGAISFEIKFNGKPLYTPHA